MKKALIISTAFVFLFLSCSKSSSTGGGTGPAPLDCNTVTNKAFASDVSPIFQASCAASGCHAIGSANGPGALTTYSQIFNARTVIRASVSSGLMPQGSTLSTAQKNSMLCWIDSGAPNN